MYPRTSIDPPVLRDWRIAISASEATFPRGTDERSLTPSSSPAWQPCQCFLLLRRDHGSQLTSSWDLVLRHHGNIGSPLDELYVWEPGVVSARERPRSCRSTGHVRSPWFNALVNRKHLSLRHKRARPPPHRSAPAIYHQSSGSSGWSAHVSA